MRQASNAPDPQYGRDLTLGGVQACEASELNNVVRTVFLVLVVVLRIVAMRTEITHVFLKLVPNCVDNRKPAHVAFLTLMPNCRVHVCRPNVASQFDVGNEICGAVVSIRYHEVFVAPPCCLFLPCSRMRDRSHR